MQRLRENTPNGPVIHADGGGGSRTLCGYTEEGSCIDGDTGFIEVDSGKINCEACISIIRHCKAITSRLISANGITCV